MAGAEDVVGGLNGALIGCKKGDRFLLGVSPKAAYKVDGPTAFVDAGSRSYPGD